MGNGEEGMPRIPARRETRWVALSGDRCLKAYDTSAGVKYLWCPGGAADAWGFDSRKGAAEAVSQAADPNGYGCEAAIRKRVDPMAGDPIGASDRNGREIRIGDRVRTDEGNWVAYVIGPRSCEDGEGGFSDCVDWAACEVLAGAPVDKRAG